MADFFAAILVGSGLETLNDRAGHGPEARPSGAPKRKLTRHEGARRRRPLASSSSCVPTSTMRPASMKRPCARAGSSRGGAR